MKRTTDTSTGRLAKAWGISLPPAQKLLLLYISDAYPSGDWYQINIERMGAFAGIPAWRVFATLQALHKHGLVEIFENRVRAL